MHYKQYYGIIWLRSTEELSRRAKTAWTTQPQPLSLLLDYLTIPIVLIISY